MNLLLVPYVTHVITTMPQDDRPDDQDCEVTKTRSYCTPDRRISGAPTPDPADSEGATYAEPVSEGEEDKDRNGEHA